MYTNNPQTNPDLKAATAAKIRAIPREECISHPKLCTSGASVSAAWRSTSGAHLGESMKHTFFKAQNSNFAKMSCIDSNLYDLNWVPVPKKLQKLFTFFTCSSFVSPCI